MTARLLIMGPQGSGKGTQAARLSEHLGVPAISTGDIFRANIRGGTELGVLVQTYTAKGELVPDEVTNAMVRDRIGLEDAKPGFLLDGYPRTLAQVKELDTMLDDYGVELDSVVSLTVDRDELVGRLLQRAQVEGRADDTEEVIRRRQEVYEEQTAPLIKVYDDRGLLLEVDGMGDIDSVSQRIFTGLDQL